MDYEGIASRIIEASGGLDNITHVTHCATRLRFVLKDEAASDHEAIQAIEGVLGVINATGQQQVILGKEVVPVYEAASKMFAAAKGGVASAAAPSTGEAGASKQPLTPKRIFDAVIGYVASAVTPLVPGLIGGGMLKVFLLLIGYAWPAFLESSSYTVLSWIANAPFYFMPIFVAYGAASKLGGTPIYAMAGAAAMLTPEFMTAVAEGTPITLLGLSVGLVKYQQQLLPALLVALAAYYIERGLNKVIPGVFRPVFVGSLTMCFSMILGFLVLGPLGSYVGSAISGVFVFLGSTVGPVAIGVLGACLPYLVMTGMHHAISPFMAQSIADPGYDPIFRPAFILHNMAEGGACLGVALRTKDAAFRSETLSLAFGCIVAGVTEPAIYGVNLRLKKPLIGVSIGGAVGGIVTGLLGARAYTMGYSTVMALPIFQDTFMAMLIGIVVAIVVAAIVTAALGFEDVKPAKSEQIALPATEA